MCHPPHQLISLNQAAVQQRIITSSLSPALRITLISGIRQWKQLHQTVSHILPSEFISCTTPDPVKHISTTKQSMIKLRLASDSIRIIACVGLRNYRKCRKCLSLCLVISKLLPKETHIAFYISKEITLQYVAMVLCQDKSESFLLALSEAELHGAPV